MQLLSLTVKLFSTGLGPTLAVTSNVFWMFGSTLAFSSSSITSSLLILGSYQELRRVLVILYALPVYSVVLELVL